MKNNFQIQVLPKIEFLDGEQDQTKKVFMKMLKSMENLLFRLSEVEKSLCVEVKNYDNK